MEIKLAMKVAHSFHRTTGLDFDDLFQEACKVYLEVEKRHRTDPAKGRKPTTWFYWTMQRGLINYCERQRKQTGHLLTNVGIRSDPEDDQQEGIEAFPDGAVPGPDQVTEFQLFLEHLEQVEPDCARLCRIILQHPERYAGLNWQQARSKLRKTLQNRRKSPVYIAYILQRMRRIITAHLGPRVERRGFDGY